VGGELAFAVVQWLVPGAVVQQRGGSRTQLDTREMLLSPASPCLVASRLIMCLISSVDLDVVAVIF